MAEKLVSVVRSPSTLGDGAVVIAAAGNESRRDQSRDYALAASLPAAAEGVVSVGAAARDGSRFDIGMFSNTPLVCAPGVAIVSAQAGGGLVAMTGTSMACPHVAGVAALWWEALREQRQPASAELVTAKLLAGARPDVFSPRVRIADRGVGLVSAPYR
jgi:subtilisin family serine protease